MFSLMTLTLARHCSYSNSGSGTLTAVDDSKIERDLIKAQAAVTSARQAIRQRQAAVMQARAAGWSKYRIGKVLGVGAPTVYSIISAAERDLPAHP